MKYTTITYKALAVSAALTLALVGCGGSNETSTKTEQKVEEKTEQVEQKTTDAATSDASTTTSEEKKSEDNTATGTDSGTQSASSSEQTGTSDSGNADEMQAQFSQEQCIANATGSTGAGSSYTNLTCSDLITGGGTLYYVVEFDLDDVHMRVMVDATDGGIIDVIEYDANGEVITYDEQQEEVVTEEQAEDNGMQAQFSQEQCIANATASTGASGSYTNLTCSDLITGGGTLYYIVEFDLDDVHMRVMVDATDGGIIDVMEFDENGEVITYDN